MKETRVKDNTAQKDLEIEKDPFGLCLEITFKFIVLLLAGAF
jgi:hypothetical protein